jgi:hypothetical protein
MVKLPTPDRGRLAWLGGPMASAHSGACSHAQRAWATKRYSRGEMGHAWLGPSFLPGCMNDKEVVMGHPCRTPPAWRQGGRRSRWRPRPGCRPAAAQLSQPGSPGGLAPIRSSMAKRNGRLTVSTALAKSKNATAAMVDPTGPGCRAAPWMPGPPPGRSRPPRRGREKLMLAPKPTSVRAASKRPPTDNRPGSCPEGQVGTRPAGQEQQRNGGSRPAGTPAQRA